METFQISPQLGHFPIGLKGCSLQKRQTPPFEEKISLLQSGHHSPSKSIKSLGLSFTRLFSSSGALAGFFFSTTFAGFGPNKNQQIARRKIPVAIKHKTTSKSMVHPFTQENTSSFVFVTQTTNHDFPQKKPSPQTHTPHADLEKKLISLLSKHNLNYALKEGKEVCFMLASFLI